MVVGASLSMYTCIVLHMYSIINCSMYNATLVCGLLLPRFVEEKCCQGDGHIENFGDEDYTEVYAQARETARSSLETTFPGAILFDPVAAFSGSSDTTLSVGAVTLRIRASCVAPAACPSGPKGIRCT